MALERIAPVARLVPVPVVILAWVVVVTVGVAFLLPATIPTDLGSQGTDAIGGIVLVVGAVGLVVALVPIVVLRKRGYLHLPSVW